MRFFNIMVIVLSILVGYLISNISYDNKSQSESTMRGEIQRVADAFDYYNERRFDEN